jgi:alkylhydroperoxidase family enzyme
MARVPYVDLKDAINIRRALANSPRGAEKNTALALYIRHDSKLDPRLREMAILQVGYSTRCIYEYAHHIEISREFGVTDGDIRAVADDTEGRPTKLDPLTKAVLRAAREMTTGLGITDAT